MILKGRVARGIFSLVLVGSLFTVACAQGYTPEEKKKGNTALEGTIKRIAPKPIAENGFLIAKKEPVNEKKATVVEEKLMVIATRTPSREKSVIAAEIAGKDIKSIKKRTAPANHSTSLKKRANYSFVANISAYSPSVGVKTASGRKAREGRTIAASRHIPIGTKVRIEGLPGIYVVEDRGGAIRGNKVDLFVGSEAKARKWGRQDRKVYIAEWGNGKVD